MGYSNRCPDFYFFFLGLKRWIFLPRNELTSVSKSKGRSNCSYAGFVSIWKIIAHCQWIYETDEHPTIPSLQVNLLHPLASLKWSEYSGIQVGAYNAQAVVLGDKVYIGRIMHAGSSSKLLVFDFCTEDLSGILDTPTEDYTLTTYHHQLVLVGGMDPNTGRATNQLWVLDKQDNWNESLPPMTIKRYQASAVSIGNHLIVAGGCSSDDSSLATVEMYDGHMWRQVQSLPRACSSVKSAVLEGNWYLAGGTGQGRKVYHTSLESLIATSEEAGQTSVWKKLPDAPLQWSTLAVLRNLLITVEAGYNYSSAICAYFPNNNSWVHVGDLPVACHSTCTLILPTEELLVIGTKRGLASCLFRANIGGNLHYALHNATLKERTCYINYMHPHLPNYNIPF